MMLKNSIIWLLLIFLTSCDLFDFSPRVYKDIIKAQESLIEHNYKDAAVRYESILNRVPTKEVATRVKFQLGEIYSIHLGDYQKALFYFDKVKEVTEDPLWLVKTEEKEGEINFQYLKNFKASSISYEKLYSFKPRLDKFDFYEYRFGYSLLQIGDLEKSKAIYMDIQKNNRHKYHNQSFFDLGMLYFYKKEWAKSIIYWQEYIKREKSQDDVVRTKFLIANAYETMEKLRKAYDIYYSILNDYPNTKVIQDRLKSIFDRKVARKR